jgi:hypothetical protein
VAAPQDFVVFGHTNAPGEYRAQLTNGVSVEVLALTSSPRTGMRWWRPNGTFLAEPPGDRLGEPSGLCPGGKSRVEFAVLLRNVGRSAPKPELAAAFEPLPQTVAWTDLYKNNVLTGQVAVLGFPATPATLACKAALVEGPWERVALWDHAGTLLHNESGSTLELQRSTADDETCLRLQHQVHPDQFTLRLAARLQNGEHRMARPCRVDYAGVKAARLSALIQGLEATNVVAYELYRLPLSWATISNIATKPDVPPMKP